MGLKKVLGSGAALVAKRHLKFDDDADDSFHTADEGNSTLDALKPTKAEANGESESESESDSDAPEEEGLSSGKDAIEKRIQEREEAARLQEEAAREKRRKNEKVFKQQQLEKKKKLLESEEEKQREKMLEFERQLVAQQGSDNDEPEELPQEFFDELESGSASSFAKATPKHITFSAEAQREEEQALKEELRKQKKRSLRELRKTQIQKGPVTVNLLSSMKVSKTLAPKKETSVMKSKDKWLKRRSLKRK
ncbi:Bud21p [Kluyveromyces lactis]|uniref:KLLA0A07623p n=1 Tax=Kluyveromyces lactis (strain ATCC 8585 / CBS 2359 / DSM 70799 / NBRC 1267 / NRRL Y-1140 / WM37) TaxID=284590 RepID=Q6CXK0_KLULA|nr:uncharacterized protein KLLA0_A07623g [Kluyveromyces lactis]CAH02927.1 KLLA0A07623p [Kluyveromyces lactis]|eukprot:XP_451339.1 uncharacterized protein KLLA0_A07623g [Kluyveromyces lactis]